MAISPEEVYRRVTLNLDHAEALQENVEHDLATAAAQVLTPEYLARYADTPRSMPLGLRNRMHLRLLHSVLPPGARP